MLSCKPMLALVAVSLALCAACGPAQVELRPAQGCDGGDLQDCRTRCEQNEARACYRLGWFYEQGQEVPRRLGKAVKLYEQACNAGMAVACRALAEIYARGDDAVQRDRERAVFYYDKACALGLEIACLTDKEKKALLRKGKKRKPKGGASVSVEVSTGD